MKKSFPLISVVIRTLNEKKPLELLLKDIKRQGYPHSSRVEVIIVDSESIDGTKELAKKFGAKLLTISQSDFSFPKSMNLGVSRAKADVVILTVGHARLISTRWFKTALNNLADPKVAGVYGPCLPLSRHTLAEWFLYMPGFWRDKLRGKYALKQVNNIGQFGATNIAIRKDLWNRHHFDERYELGGEDIQWAKWAIGKGYKIICDTDFSVRHSHGLGWLGVWRQLEYWRSLMAPTKYDREAFKHRKNLRW